MPTIVIDRKTFDAVREFSESGRLKRVLVSCGVAAALAPFGSWQLAAIWAVSICVWEYSVAPRLDTVIGNLADRGETRKADILLRMTIAIGGLAYLAFLALVAPLPTDLAEFVVVAWTAGSLIHGSVYYAAFADYQRPIFVMNAVALVGSPFVFVEGAFAACAASVVLSFLVFAILTFAKDRNSLVRDLQNARLLAESNSDAKLRFLALVSHEIRTPLSGVAGLTDLLATTKLDATQQRMIHLMQSSSSTLARLVDDVLLATKGREGRMTLAPAPFDLAQAVHHAAEPFRASVRGSHVELHIDTTSLAETWFFGDAGRVKQIVANLVSNALKFTTTGYIAVRASGADGSVTIEVTDSGIGMSQEDASRVFDPFAQTPDGVRAGGTGLGLSIVRMLSELMGGTVNVESHVGVGTSFFVYLPLSASAKAPEYANFEQRSVQQIAPAPHISVLVVDDNEVNREVLRLTLQAANISPTLAENGEQALELADRSSFDIVFLDYRLPGIDGLQVARRLRSMSDARGLKSKLILSTANDLEGLEAAARAAGIDAFLPKPLRPHAILECVSNA